MKRTILMLALVVLLAQPVLAMMPLDCEEFLNGGGQGYGHDCIETIIHIYDGHGGWSYPGPFGGGGVWWPQ